MIETKWQKVCAEIAEWLQSPEGKAHMEKVGGEIRQMLADFKEQEDVSVESLHKPMTI